MLTVEEYQAVGYWSCSPTVRVVNGFEGPQNNRKKELTAFRAREWTPDCEVIVIFDSLAQLWLMKIAICRYSLSFARVPIA
jgi:hypothetical protein